MSLSQNISRRRFISVIAATTASTLLPLEALASANKSYTWSGEALGAKTSITLVTGNTAEAKALVLSCLREMDRLENVFSLYRANPAIRLLNKNGKLENPPLELVELIKRSIQLSELSNGAFDISVQPLLHYYLYTNQDELDPKRIKELQTLINYQAIEASSDSISFLKPQMMITLNGIAQGFITDRISGIFNKHGFTNALVELGETSALGKNKEGKNWQIGIENISRESIARVIELSNMSLATSGGYGTFIDEKRGLNHIIQPSTAHSTNKFKSVSVVAKSATDADGLSTTLSLLDKNKHREVLEHFPGSWAHLIE